MPTTAAPCASRAGPTDQVRLSLMTLDAGLQSFEIFRLTREGRGDWARWTSDRELLAHGTLPQPGAQAYDQLTAAIASATQEPAEFEAAAPMGRLGFSLTLVQVEDATLRQSVLTSVPPALADLIETWRQQRESIALERGWYLWMSPVPSGGAGIDVDLSAGPCRGPLEATLAEALNDGRLVVHVREGIDDFISGERQYRTTFTAKTPNGRLHFGVLTTK